MASAAVVCEEKARLLRENDQAINRYHQTALRELERQRATSSTPDYEQLAKAVYDARVLRNVLAVCFSGTSRIMAAEN